MITGTVTNDLDILITLDVADGNGVFVPLEVVLDTGFNGDLSLPAQVIRSLGLTYRGRITCTLATGEEAALSNYDGVALWHGQPRDVAVIETGGEALLGMALLMGSRITIDARVGGEARIEESPPSE